MQVAAQLVGQTDLAEHIAHRGHPAVVACAGVEPEFHWGAGVETGLGEQLLSLVGVVLAPSAARPGVVTDHHRRGERIGYHPGAQEDRVDDRLAVDGHRQRAAHAHVGVALVVEREGQTGDSRARLLKVVIFEDVLGVGVGIGRQTVQDVEIAGKHVGVGGGQFGVDPHHHAAGFRLVLAGVVVVATQGDTAARHPLGIGLERPVADRLLAECHRIGVESLGQRIEPVIAERDREDRERLGQGDLNGGGIGRPQSGHPGGGRLLTVAALQGVIALHAGEEIGRALGVGAQCGVVPRPHVGLRGNRGAVVKGPARLDFDGPLAVVGGGDRLGGTVVGDGPAALVEGDQRRP